MTPENRTPPGQYNVYSIVELGDERFTAEVTDNGVYFDHSYEDGCLFISHEDFEELEQFRQEFLAEIDHD